MAAHEYGITGFQYIAAGAAILASGGGGSYRDAVNVIAELANSWSGTVQVQDYDGATNWSAAQHRLCRCASLFWLRCRHE